ncbi:MAG: hypothetical protein KJO44_01105, partial [Gemmatimonadetes bacterium]|nr:hypothetical protein [Gemmatimonadota bacterium]
MPETEERKKTDSDRTAEDESTRLLHVGLHPELSAWQRRELNQLLIELPECSALPEAMAKAMRGICEAMGWSAAFARWDDGSVSGSEWHCADASLADTQALESALARGPVARWNEDGKGPTVRLEPLIGLPETRAREAARNVGLSGYALLPILAAGKPVALLELLSTT